MVSEAARVRLVRRGVARLKVTLSPHSLARSLSLSLSHSLTLTPDEMRLQLEGELAVLYHCVDNSRDFEGKPEQCLEFDADYFDAMQHLIDSYPAYTQVPTRPTYPGI
eukprot:2041689-Rhodomonas_salina.1